MESAIIFAVFGVAAGLALGAAQLKLLKRMLPGEDGRLRAGWALPVKFALWAAAILVSLRIDAVFLLALVGAATVFYLGSAVALYFRSR